MTDPVLDALTTAGLKRVLANTPMARHTSWHIGGPADYLCTVESEAELWAAVGVAVDAGIPWLVLGGGNNILVADAGVEGLVILNRLRGIQIEVTADGPQLVCGAGVFFARAAQYSAKAGYGGMEWGIAIPGTTAGGVVNNAGAHGCDVGGTLVSAMVVDASGRHTVVSPKDLAYRYRHSAFKTPVATQSRLVVTEVRFRLYPDQGAAARVEELRLHRLRTQPVKEASAGSTFKNPPGGFAGELVEAAGLKGHRMGGAQISPLHANFILNVNKASAADVLALIALMQEKVQISSGVHLEPEVQFVGRWSLETLAPVLGASEAMV